MYLVNNMSPSGVSTLATLHVSMRDGSVYVALRAMAAKSHVQERGMM